MDLTADQRRALAIIASAGPRGITEGLMVEAHAFTIELLVELIRHRYVTAETETTRTGNLITQTVRLRITTAGREALASEL
jgi:hypothetical protein